MSRIPDGLISHLKPLAVVAGLGVIFGILGLAEPLEGAFQVIRNKLRTHPSSGQIVLVALDDRSVSEIGSAPWQANDLTRLLSSIRGASPKRVHLDLDLPDQGSRASAGALSAEMRRAGSRLSLSSRFAFDPLTGKRQERSPSTSLAPLAGVVNVNTKLDWDNTAWEHPYGAITQRKVVPSLASYLAGSRVQVDPRTAFPIDYAIDLRTIPLVSASDLMKGRVKVTALAGKDVVIGRTDVEARRFSAPGYSVVPAILIQIVAAETLLAGTPIDLGWFLAFTIAALFALGGLRIGNKLVAIASTGSGVATLLTVPLLLEAYQIHVRVMPGLAVLIAAGCMRAWTEWRQVLRVRSNTNSTSGMPNMQALLETHTRVPGILVSLRIQNRAQIRATLADQGEKELVSQVVSRLRFGAAGSLVYQADDGTFVWESKAPEGELQIQLDGLYALFRSPAVVGGRLLDVQVTFGYDVDTERLLLQRVAGTLAAADEAALEGSRWKCFDPASLEEAEWTLSLLGRLDQALETGQLWVAYQPKIDCVTGEAVGAEALVRWTHPEKGNIFPDQFIGAAEQSGRIAELTRFVLNEAVSTAAGINSLGREFSIAVNLSATLLEDDTIVEMVKDALDSHVFRPELLVLEITETSTLRNGTSAEKVLTQLKRLGVQLSIDDYGTGFSTLEYLKKIPASEIKIDRTFISMLHRSQSDRIMVHSTIQLAHSLNRKVVAEGVENAEILNELIWMGCDFVQGYHTARPMPKWALRKYLTLAGTEEAPAELYA